MINIGKNTNIDQVVVIVENIIDIRKNDERVKYLSDHHSENIQNITKVLLPDLLKRLD